MFRRCGNFLCILAVCALVNGHLAILQGVAWARMAIDYSQTSSFGVAFVQTFDGQHPCALCKKITAAKRHDQPLLRFNLMQDLKCLVAVRPALKPFDPLNSAGWKSSAASFVPDWGMAPPTPPPRSPRA